MVLREFLGLSTLALLIAMTGLAGVRLQPILKAMRQARPVSRFDRLGYRFASMMVQVFGHKRLLRIRLAGIIHLFIFSGFVILMLDILETIGQLISPSFSLGSFLETVVDVWVLIVLAGVVLALYQRRVLKPKRFEGSDEHDAEVILALITLIVLGIVLHNSFFSLLAGPVFGVSNSSDGHFLGSLLAHLWTAIGLGSPGAASVGYSIGYLLDIGIVLWFLAYLPTSKHLHVLFGVPAVFLRNLEIPGQLIPPDEGGQALEADPIRSFNDMNWKDILDLFTCTECGRCQDVCPAHQSGQPLSPKMLILDLRDALLAQMGNKGQTQSVHHVSLAGDVISAETLWACTTCGACQEACPVFIEHVPKIVGLRAALVEEGAAVEERAQDAFEHLLEQKNAYGKHPESRPSWNNKVGYYFKDLRREPADWLWFVGDVASFDNDPGVLNSIQAISALLKRAEVDVGLLFESEVSSGNDVLRMGEFGLFQSLAEENIAAMSKAKFQRVLTSDPHSFNALRNDYPQLGFNKPIYHYSQVLLELMEEGRLCVERPLNLRVTFHDPCYLGRWNRVFEAPREVLRRCGVTVIEMPRNRENSFCCGAGGGRIWMNEAGIRERPSEARIREALELPDITHFVVCCPKDIVMYSAAVSALGYSHKLKVVDIAELVAIAVGIQILQSSAS
jgi:Fe-S oxidoreductase